MRIRTSLIATISLAALSVQSVALAYSVENIWTGDSPRRGVEKRDYNALPAQPALDSSMTERMKSTIDTSGREMLGRVRARRMQRNFNRHYVGWQRDGDYRVLNLNGDMRRYQTLQTAPSRMYRASTSIVDRPTRRSDIRMNRNRDILSEIYRYGTHTYR